MANPPITIGPFDNVPAPGSPIRSNWPQDITQFAVDHQAAMALPNHLAGNANTEGMLRIASGQVATVLDGNGLVLVAFPVPFVTVVTVMCTNGDWTKLHFPTATSVTLANFTLSVRKLDTGAPAAGEACQVSWLAVGRRS